MKNWTVFGTVFTKAVLNRIITINYTWWNAVFLTLLEDIKFYKSYLTKKFCLITRRPQVQILSPQPSNKKIVQEGDFFIVWIRWKDLKLRSREEACVFSRRAIAIRRKIRQRNETAKGRRMEERRRAARCPRNQNQHKNPLKALKFQGVLPYRGFSYFLELPSIFVNCFAQKL